MDDGFYRVVLPYAVYGVDVRMGQVMFAAPIGKWAIGRKAAWFSSWVEKKGGSIERLS